MIQVKIDADLLDAGAKPEGVFDIVKVFEVNHVDGTFSNNFINDFKTVRMSSGIHVMTGKGDDFHEQAKEFVFFTNRIEMTNVYGLNAQGKNFISIP